MEHEDSSLGCGTVSPGTRRLQQNLCRTGKTSFPPLTQHRMSMFSHGIYQQCRYRSPTAPGCSARPPRFPGAQGAPAPAAPLRPGGTAGPSTPPAGRERPACSGEGHGPLPAPAPGSPPRRSHKPGTRALCAAHEP